MVTLYFVELCMEWTCRSTYIYTDNLDNKTTLIWKSFINPNMRSTTVKKGASFHEFQRHGNVWNPVILSAGIVLELLFIKRIILNCTKFKSNERPLYAFYVRKLGILTWISNVHEINIKNTIRSLYMSNFVHALINTTLKRLIKTLNQTNTFRLHLLG